jgi:hypothetical protein
MLFATYVTTLQKAYNSGTSNANCLPEDGVRTGRIQDMGKISLNTLLQNKIKVSCLRSEMKHENSTSCS